mmetsp:Transcript_24568/g.70638  ORF Transcript_24568/g.70638 Transcript_24568/m.70638 type:complete len:205 (-) Transcript_24568:543-1157(-)
MRSSPPSCVGWWAAGRDGPTLTIPPLPLGGTTLCPTPKPTLPGCGSLFFPRAAELRPARPRLPAPPSTPLRTPVPPRPRPRPLRLWGLRVSWRRPTGRSSSGTSRTCPALCIARRSTVSRKESSSHRLRPVESILCQPVRLSKLSTRTLKVSGGSVYVMSMTLPQRFTPSGNPFSSLLAEIAALPLPLPRELRSIGMPMPSMPA